MLFSLVTPYLYIPCTLSLVTLSLVTLSPCTCLDSCLKEDDENDDRHHPTQNHQVDEWHHA